MKFIETKTHGYVDYLVAILLIASPWLFGFYRGGAESWTPIVLGIMVIVYSLITNYELGAIAVFSMPTHLAMDVIGGIVLAASPWIFNFNEYVYAPHLAVGIADIGIALFTKRQPSYGPGRRSGNLNRAAQ